MVQYTQAQKLAYYKRKAQAQKAPISGRGAYRSASARRAPLRGRGAYSKAAPRAKKSSVRSSIASLGSYGGPLGGALGTALAGPVGGIVGSGLGALGGSLFKHFVGKGDYEVVNNCFLKGGEMCEPIVNPHRTGGDVFRRTEYLSDVITSSNYNSFQNTSYSVNPGLESTFEWLSQIAANYEEYEIEGMYFEFRSMSADALNSTNTALGQVIMAANYNAASPNFLSKQTMENYEGGISCRPSENMRYFVECAKTRTVLSALYIRQGAVPAGQDQRLYDLCNFQVATNGFQAANVNIGELWVTYQICLRKPKMFSALGLYNSFLSASPTTGAYTNLDPLGSSGAWNISPSSTLIGPKISGSALSWSPPTIPQTYMIYIVWTGSSTAIDWGGGASFSNGLGVQSVNQTPASGQTCTIASMQLYCTYTPDFNPTNANPTMQMAINTLPSSGIAVSIYVIQVPNTLYNI